MGDFNAKIGSDYKTWAPALGKFGLGVMNSRGEKLMEFCMIHRLAVSNTYFQHKDCRRATWTSPGGLYKNQIDFILVYQDDLKSVKNSRSFCSADIGSDHNLVLANVQFQPPKARRIKSVQKSYDVGRFKNPSVAEEFQARIGGAFEPLLLLEDTDIDELWLKFMNATNETTKQVVGIRRGKQVKHLPEHVRDACELRRKARVTKLNSPHNNHNIMKYRRLNKKVKYEVKKWKRETLKKEVEEMEAAQARNDSHELFKKVRKLAGEKEKIQPAAKNKEGVLKTAPGDVLDCWKEHFSTHLNTEFPRDTNTLRNIPEPPTENQTSPFTIEEVKAAIKALKNNKATGFDNIAAETLKAGGPAMAQILLKIINTAFTQGKTPVEWSKGLITPVHKKGDKLDPANYRAITLLSVPAKVFCRMVLSRIQGTIEEHLSEEQCGFRSSRGTTDAIFIVRQVLEKAKERHIPIHWNFVDFKAAFDTVWRDALWKCLLSIGVEKNLIDLIKYMYDQTKCAVIVNGKVTEWFQVKTGVRQGCLLSQVCSTSSWSS